MHRVVRLLGTIGVAASFAVTVVAGTALAAASAVGLGTAGGFAVLAATTITNTGPTTITGNVGLHPGSAITGFGSVTLHGAKHVADGVALKAKNDLVTAYNDAAGRTPVTTVATELGGKSLKAGVYNSTAGTFGVTGTLTLDAQGNSQAVFIFQTASTLITAPGSSVALINGASACNVFWKVGSSATLDTTTKFKGTIMALTSISLKTGATLQGRALARNGAVTMDSNVITDAACASTIPNTAMPRGGGPLAMAVPMSLLLIGVLAILMFGALLGVRSLGPRR
jgi:Ice-binding-like